MAGRKTRANGIKSWFLLKVSVIFVLMMCLNFFNLIFVGSSAQENNATTVVSTSQATLKLATTTFRAITQRPTLNFLIKWIEKHNIQQNQNKRMRSLTSSNYKLGINSKSFRDATNNNSRLADGAAISSGDISKISSYNEEYNKKDTKNDLIATRLRETFLMPSSDSELEAKIMYEKSLKEFGAMEGRTLKQICSTWQQRRCDCSGQLDQISLKCHGLGLVEIPLDVPNHVVYLDLGNNNITKLPAKAFDFVPNLEELILSNNLLKKIDNEAFLGLSKLKRLSLQNCGLNVLPGDSFQHIPNLVSLLLTGNTLADMDSSSLKYLKNLRTLRLEGNLFYKIPTDALAEVKTLEILNMGNNLLTIIRKDDIPELTNLVILLLKRNHVHEIEDDSFKNLINLKILDLSDNFVTKLPNGLNKLRSLQEFTISGNRVNMINQSDIPKSLLSLDMRANPLVFIKKGALQGITRLRKLILSDVRTLKDFPDLEGCVSLEILRLDRAGLKNIAPNLCRIAPGLKSLELKTNELTKIPELGNCKNLRLLDLSSNKIETLNGKPFRHLTNLHDLLLSYNRINGIPYDAFFGSEKLQLLDLEGNVIASIHEKAFSSFKQLEDLNLGQNIFPYLPSTGLEHLVHLKTFNNPKLREFPNPDVFPKIRTLVLSYAYHCCPFLPLVTAAVTRKPPLVHEAVLFPSSDFDLSLWNNSMTDIWPQLNNLTNKLGPQMHEILDNFGQDFIYPGNLPTYVEDYFEEDDNNVLIQPQSDFMPGAVQCLPIPGPFLPCVDLFDWWTLRCGVWVVFLLAMFGNGTVVFVLVFSKSKMDVPRFLVCNLAAADFFMGVYLGILAVVDASTFNEFRMYAIPWQMSVFCQIAGFLAVLSSELSVYTLAVITLERNYAITNAIHLNKRLSLKQATYVMIFGWTFALTMAILPLVGISDYRKFAICLPFETTTSIASLSYVVALMFINGCAFLILMGCYLKMYWAIRGSQAWNTNDSRIAKRMALLVFTDFLCWSPIAFFSLTAVFGLQLISLEQAKIFTVFILPLNSCCNPFLYAIMTKQFKKDCFTLCKTLEETRVSKAAAVRTHERRTKELPPLLPNPHIGCRCLRMLPHEMPKWQKFPKKENIFIRIWNRLFCKKKKKKKDTKLRRPGRDPYTYQFAEIKASIKKSNRASSISSENFCSSRSSSWKNGAPPLTHSCSIPLRVMDPATRRRHSAWLITRKTSQDSNLSSSRNDSSASATTASTSTFRLSRSSASSSTPIPSMSGGPIKQNSFGSKPKLVRQQAVVQEEIEIVSGEISPPRLGVRFLPTIPSAADSSVIMEDNSNSNSNEETAAIIHLYAVLQQGGNPKTTISSPVHTTDKPP